MRHPKFTMLFIKECFEKEKYILLEREYSGQRQKLSFVCPVGHKYFIQFGSWRAGRRCAICAGRRIDLKYVVDTIENFGYTMLDEYRESGKNIRMMCPKKHECYITWDNFKQGHRCGKCRGQVSKFELKLLEAIKEKYSYLEILHKDRKIIKPYEIDIVIPKYKIAIEYNGAGHHLPIYGSTKEDRLKNLNDIMKKDVIKKQKLKELEWTFLFVDDRGAFNENIFSRVFRFLVERIDNKIFADEYSKGLTFCQLLDAIT